MPTGQDEFPTPIPSGEDREIELMTRSLDEGKALAQTIYDFLSRYGETDITGDDGQRYWVLAIPIGPGDETDLQEWRLRESPGKDGFGQVRVGTCTGLGLSGKAPDGFTRDTWAEFRIDDVRAMVYLEFEIEPAAGVITYNEVNEVYYMEDGGSIVGGEYQLKVVPASEALASTDPDVNPADGATSNGTFQVILGYVGGGQAVVQNKLGPLTLKFCARNSFTATGD